MAEAKTTFNPEELAAMYGLPLECQVVYMRGLRPFMDFKTGIVGIPSAVTKGISYQSLSEVLYIEPGQGRNLSEPKTNKQARGYVERLVQAGVLERLSIKSVHKKQLILKCVLADVDYSVQNQLGSMSVSKPVSVSGAMSGSVEMVRKPIKYGAFTVIDSAMLGSRSGARLGSVSGSKLVIPPFYNNQTNKTRGRALVAIDPDFSIDVDVRLAMDKSGVSQDLAEYFIVEFVTENIESGWRSDNWPVQFVQYCKAQRGRYRKPSKLRRMNRGRSAEMDFIKSLPDSLTKYVWLSLVGKYGNKFLSKLRDERVRDELYANWQAEMKGITDNQRDYGLAAWRDDWPPDAAAFRRLCREVVAPKISSAAEEMTADEKARSREAGIAARSILPKHLRMVGGEKHG